MLLLRTGVSTLHREEVANCVGNFSLHGLRGIDVGVSQQKHISSISETRWYVTSCIMTDMLRSCLGGSGQDFEYAWIYFIKYLRSNRGAGAIPADDSLLVTYKFIFIGGRGRSPRMVFHYGRTSHLCHPGSHERCNTRRYLHHPGGHG